MVRIGVVSDSHRGFYHVAEMLAQAGKLDWLLHAGDHLQDAARIAADLGLAPEQVRAVVGNCDYPRTEPGEVLLEVEQVRIYMTHGHLHGVKSNLQRLHYRAQELGARVAIFGHSHVAVVTDVGGVMLLNPGSLSQPRRWEDRPSWALLEVDGHQVTARHFFFGSASI